MIAIAPTRDRYADAGLFVLRVVVGTVFFAHGWQKVFIFGVDAMTPGFAQMGIPYPELVAPFIAGLELVGGVALILGLGTRIFSVLLACDMLGAMWFAHLRNGFFLPAGIEFTLALWSVCVALALMGAGFLSLDGTISQRRTATPMIINRDVRHEGRRVETGV